VALQPERAIHVTRHELCGVETLLRRHLAAPRIEARPQRSAGGIP
jgi:hypothetical protein